MELILPQSATHPLIKVTVTAPNYESVTYLDTSHTTFTPDLPEGVDPELVNVTASLCDQHQSVIPAQPEWTLKTASKPDDRPSQGKRLIGPKTKREGQTKQKVDRTERKTDRATSTYGGEL